MSFIQQPLDEFLGFEYDRTADDTISVTLPVQPLYLNSVGVLHGGVISALVDVAMSNLVPATRDGTQKAVTVDLHTTFIQGARGQRLVAKAKNIRQGRTMMYAECHVYDDQNQLVARATGTFFIRQET